MKSLFELRIKSIRKELGYLSPSRILYEIENDPYIKDYTYVILGKSGPTGKTWLWNKLKSRGFTVIEISEYIHRLVNYTDTDNYCLVDHFNKAIIIVLNCSLKQD